jgi:hypothetical protein
MAKKKSKKHPKDMTNEELAAHVFHPKVLKHAKKHLAELDAPKVPKESVK